MSVRGWLTAGVAYHYARRNERYHIRRLERSMNRHSSQPYRTTVSFGDVIIEVEPPTQTRHPVPMDRVMELATHKNRVRMRRFRKDLQWLKGIADSNHIPKEDWPLWLK